MFGLLDCVSQFWNNPRISAGIVALIEARKKYFFQICRKELKI